MEFLTREPLRSSRNARHFCSSKLGSSFGLQSVLCAAGARIFRRCSRGVELHPRRGSATRFSTTVQQANPRRGRPTEDTEAGTGIQLLSDIKWSRNTCPVNFRGLAQTSYSFIFKDAHGTAAEADGNGSRKPCRKVASFPGTGSPPEHAGEAARCRSRGRSNRLQRLEQLEFLRRRAASLP